MFIGNDGKRDYDFAVEIANQMSEYKFIFVSKQINQEVAKSNIEILNGKWDENLLTDSDIRDIYRKSLISIIPLKNSFQPSGQSVALQSMSMKIPVIITKTNGFWDKSKFSHNKNIIFTKTNSLKEWEEKIEQLFLNKNLTESIVSSAYETINNNYTIEKFYKDFKKILF